MWEGDLLPSVHLVFYKFFFFTESYARLSVKAEVTRIWGISKRKA